MMLVDTCSVAASRSWPVSHIFSIAKELVRLSLAGEEADPLTNLRLQKLLYYAQAWSLILRDRDLFSEDVVAWRYGPVVPEVYRKLSDGLGASAITLALFENAPDVADEDEAAFLANVWDAYKEFSALKLSDMTHKESPWIKAWGNRPTNATGDDPIKAEYLEEFFSKQSVPEPLEKYRIALRLREEEAEKQMAALPAFDVVKLRSVAKSGTKAAFATK